MYANKTVTNEIFLDGDDEADRKTVEWLKRELERREQKRSAASVSS